LHDNEDGFDRHYDNDDDDNNDSDDPRFFARHPRLSGFDV